MPDGTDGHDGIPDDGGGATDGSLDCQATADCPADNGVNDGGYYCDTSQDTGQCVTVCGSDADCPEDQVNEDGTTTDYYCDISNEPAICKYFTITGGN
ncbi:MAG: hypothetical protein A3I75_07860 [Deltaproteobacteria bacterium RIFCSPLOWO2_02_FULL_50_16]|nr:MAG: hypothetical protein A3I75_07860 [Deltaproteobacteria bacterium RIFCSPLOWO2_02_FULL_50_16]OGQ67880.1 MAG: hypothetical protein A3F89_06910 [Deltaproteobacteria bacterium RIFCSPLOWO2_12_FULL_50_11]